jgi:phosphoglycerol geranylgeranyltransferase
MDVKTYILSKIRNNGALHMTLIDPEDISLDRVGKMCNLIEKSNSDSIMVGGSTVSDTEYLSKLVIEIKHHTSLPVILFPNNVTGITKYADAIWFMSLLNSTNPYFITGAQMIAAPYIRKIDLECLSMAYLIIGEGKSAGFVGQANPIPPDKPEIALAYAIAAELFGFDFIYLEGGSGISKPIPNNLVKIVKRGLLRSKLIVGGGIRSYKDAYNIVKAGADIIVTGTIIEEDPEKIFEIVKGVKDAGRAKKNERNKEK